MKETKETRFEPTELLAQTDWIRTLARRLVYDPSEVDDVVQETWVAIVRRPPLRTVPVRCWLAAVVRNVARQRGRGEGRRRRREQAGATDEAQPSTDGVVARAEAHKAVVASVLELEEPYRESVLLRYFDELPPREIARRMECPVATVHTRLRRATQRMRAALDRRSGGDGRSWLSLLAPLLLVRPAAAAAGGGALLAAAGLLAALAVGWGIWNARESTTPPSRTEASARVVPVESSTSEPEEPEPMASPRPTARVVDPEGQPVEGAGVWVLPASRWPAISTSPPLAQLETALEAFRAQRPRAADVQTRADGRFDLPSGPLAIGKPGYLMVTADSTVDGATIRLARAAVMKGIVQNAEGTPLAGARVRLVGGHVYQFAAPLVLASMTTAADGRFEFPNSPAGGAVWIEHPEYPPFLFRPGTSVLGKMSEDSDVWHPIRLSSWRQLTGEVVSADAAPVVGAHVAITSGFGDTPQVTARTDERGRFLLRFGVAREGSRMLHVDAGDEGVGSFVVEEGEREKRCVLGAAVTVRGRVVGGEVAGCTVYAVQSPMPWRSARVATDGTFVLRGLREAEPAWIVFDPWHAVWEDDAEFKFGRGIVARTPGEWGNDVVIALRRKSTVRARIVTPSGESVRGASVERIYWPQLAAKGSLTLIGLPLAAAMPQPDGSGVFVWRGVTRRLPAIAVDVRAPGFVNRRFHLPTTPDGEVRIELAPGRRLSGFVRFEDGTAAEGVLVFASQQAQVEDPDARVRQRVRTDVEGRFEFDGLTDEPFYVTARAPRGWLPPGYQTRRPGAGPVEIALRKGSVFRGVVRDGNGLPVVGASIGVMRDGKHRNFRQTTRSDGSFLYDALESGSYTLQVWATGFLPITLKEVTIPDDGRTVLTLRRGLSIRGTVLRHDGKPAAYVSVSADRSGGAQEMAGRHASSHADEKGRFELAGLSAGRFRIRVRTQSMKGDQVYDDIREVEAGTTVQVRGRLGLFLEGMVRHASGVGVERALVEAYSSAQPLRPVQAFADADGRFRLGPLRAGDYDLLAFTTDRESCGFRWDVDSRAGHVDLVVGSGRSVRGAVVDEKGEPADANVYLGVVGRLGWQMHVPVQARRKGGRFVLRGLPPGKLRIEVMPVGVHVLGFRGREIDPVDGEELKLTRPPVR
ncbi:MAG: sigma-70 family RNA polymerase sigma factor [Planctomycetota bacterium]